MEAARKTTEDPDWVTVPQAAREIGCANATVLSLIVRGELQTQVVAGRPFVSRASIAAYRAKRAGATE